jgi:hypothetical protein
VPVGVEPVEAAAAGAVVVGLRAGPEPALGVARRVVHPRPRGGDVGDRVQRAIQGQAGEAAVGGEQPALVAEHRCDRADRARHAVAADRDQGPVVLDAISVDPPGEDVDSQQLATPGVPPSPLAEFVLVCRARAEGWPSARGGRAPQSGGSCSRCGGSAARRATVRAAAWWAPITAGTTISMSARST